VSLIALAVILAGALFGTFLRNTFPDHHLADDTRDYVRLGTGLIATIAGLVLGLLIASAKSSYDTESSQVRHLTANIVLLDRLLDQYGPEARDAFPDPGVEPAVCRTDADFQHAAAQRPRAAWMILAAS
jgi:hypothetical protein